MKKLLNLYDKYFLKFGISFLLLFTALYPKLPSIHIIRTWVYIRLEDFFILALVVLWFIQVLRKKVRFPAWIGGSIIGYWIVGLISLIYSFIYIAPYLNGFFHHIAFLQYLRRIEYMILFFIAFTTIKNSKDIRDYFIILIITLIGIITYGFGQKYYLLFWSWFPDFFSRYSFCFPSFQTGNEEFAKGIPLCLPEVARITSTFGGHYDLGAYLAMVLPVLLGVFLTIKKRIWRAGVLAVFFLSLILLIFTASRISFASYIIGAITALILIRKKIYIIPLIIISVLLLFWFNDTTAQRFYSTVRLSSIVTNSQGELIGEATTSLPEVLRNKISNEYSPESTVIQEQTTFDPLPQGSAFIGLPEKKVAPKSTEVAVVKKTLSPEEAKRLQLAEGSMHLSTVSGNFVIRQALVYDISFTTRFQAEWPNAWKAFLRNPWLGSGYSTITLATDNDYLRALGETGALGLFSFIFIFIIFGITFVVLAPFISAPLAKGFVYGLAGGVTGLAANAVLIDVFESSKVAENLWMLLGIGAGALFLNKRIKINYLKELKKLFATNFFISFYFLLLIIIAFLPSASNFFVADDFVWLYWAASASVQDMMNFFIDAQNYFYRPLSKTISVILYNFLAFKPMGYHVFSLLLHFLAVFAVYLLSRKLLKNKLLAFLTGIIFLFHPAHSENLYWFASFSSTLCTVFMLYGLYFYINFREQKNYKAGFSYILTLTFSVLALLTNEIAIVMPLLLIAADLIIVRIKTGKAILIYSPIILLILLYFWLRFYANAFMGGGDYAYSLSHFIPNILGNFVGYIGVFIIGNQFYVIYDWFREQLRSNLSLFFLTVLFSGLTIFYLVKKLKKFYLLYTHGPYRRVLFFGLIFAFISLILFLPLGNIAGRYLYLASFGFSLMLVIIIHNIITSYSFGKGRKYTICLVALIILLGILYHLDSSNQMDKWRAAGEITKETLTHLKINNERLPLGSNLFFIDTPISKNGVWVFPVGLKEGLWFIYGQELPGIYQVTDLEEAKRIIKTDNIKEYNIFKYGDSGKLEQIKL